LIKILCDSGTDVPKDVVEKYSVTVVPLRVFLDDKEYRDGVDIGEEEILKFMEDGGIPKTSQPTYEDVYKAFQDAIDEGYEEILAINISSGLSGTHNVFKLVESKLKEEHPHLKLEIVDSLNISVSSGLLIYKAAKLASSGKDINLIANQLNEIAKTRLKVYYTIPTLKYLKAGGRIGRVAASMGEMLNLKPVISCDDKGIYYTVMKAFGMRKAVDKMIAKMEEFAASRTIEAVSIARTGDLSQTISFVNMIKKETDKLNVKEVFIGKINASMMVHTGVGLVGFGILVD
jgi:DegV family protein with EDD domain